MTGSARTGSALILLPLVLVFLLACPPSANATDKPTASADVAHQGAVTDNTAENYVSPPLPMGKVLIPDAYGTNQVVEVELATDDKSRERGLMWRRELKGGKGMLFLFDGEYEHSFWMKNTLIPLDMLFIRADGVIAGIVENATPRSLSSRTVGKISQYVLEVPGGWCAKVGVRSGTKVELQLPPGIETR